MRGVFCYVGLIEHIRENNIEYIDNVLDLIPSMSLSLKRKNNICKSSLSLRNYQRQALSSWIGAKMSGRLTALQREDIKEDVHKSATTVQTKAFYVGSAKIRTLNINKY
jgi:hypothetical protein